MNYEDLMERAEQHRKSTDRWIKYAFLALIVVATLEIVYACIYFSIAQPVMGVFMVAKSALIFFGAFWLKRI